MAIDGFVGCQQLGRGAVQGAGLTLMRDLIQLDVMEPDPIAIGHDDLLHGRPVLPAEAAGPLEIEGTLGLDHAPAIGAQGVLAKFGGEGIQPLEIVLQARLAAGRGQGDAGQGQEAGGQDRLQQPERMTGGTLRVTAGRGPWHGHGSWVHGVR